MVKVLIVRPPTERLFQERAEALDELANRLRDAGYEVRTDYQEQLEGARGVTWWEVVLIYVAMKGIDRLTEEAINSAIDPLVNAAKEWTRTRFRKKTRNNRPEYVALLNDEGEILQSWTIDNKGEHDKTDEDKKRPYRHRPRAVE